MNIQITEKPWQRIDLGWIPNPKHADAVYFNHILEEYYTSMWSVIPYPSSFKPRFQAEKRRMWDIKKQHKIESRVRSFAHNTSMILSSEYKPKPYDIKVIQDHLQNLIMIKTEAQNLQHKIETQDNTCFVENTNKL